MTRGLLPPELEREIETLKRRVSDLERRLESALDRLLGDDAIFYFDGILPAVTSGIWRSRETRPLDEWLVTLTEPGSTDTVLWILLNGATAFSITIPAGETEVEETSSITVRRTVDSVQVQVASAGIGALDLTVQGGTRG